MARKFIGDTDVENQKEVKGEERDLSSLIKEFYPLNESSKNLKKQADEISTQIKTQLKEQNMLEFETDELVAKVTYVENKSLNEFAAIEYLKAFPHIYAKVVKTREYIDEEAVEALVYNGEFNASELSAFVEVKAPTVRLNVIKNKKGKSK